jgi:hypothetical protein
VLTHYTGSSEAVANILTHGFAWIPNRRKLATLLIPQHDFSRREPQQFGMISFTELEPTQTRAHRERFGAFGIVVAERWALECGAQRVIYLDDEGPLTVALGVLFEIGYADVTRRIEYPDDAGWLMAYENKNAAGAIAGSRLWAHLLQLWEYLEPASSSAQREWRIVNPDPLYSLSENKSEAIAQISPPQSWAKFTNVLAIQRSEVVALICRGTDMERLQSQLPPEYASIRIITTDD